LGYILYTTILIARVLDATDQVRTEKLTAAKSVDFSDGDNVEDADNVEHLTKETIVLPVNCPSVMGKAIIVLSSGKITIGES
jgi:hypothetical protein